VVSSISEKETPSIYRRVGGSPVSQDKCKGKKWQSEETKIDEETDA